MWPACSSPLCSASSSLCTPCDRCVLQESRGSCTSSAGKGIDRYVTVLQEQARPSGAGRRSHHNTNTCNPGNSKNSAVVDAKATRRQPSRGASLREGCMQKRATSHELVPGQGPPQSHFSKVT